MERNVPTNTAGIPKPSGSYAVGCTDIMTSPSGSGIFFRLYYPTASIEDADPPKWLPDKNYLKGFANYFGIWPTTFTYLYPMLIGEVYVPAAWNTPPLTDGRQQFPVLVFSHGLAACRTTYTTICLELASNGYVVAAVEHRDFSATATFYFEDSNPKVSTRSTLNVESEVSEDLHSSEEEKQLNKKYIYLKKIKADAQESAIRNKQVHIRSKECSAVLDWLQRLNDGGQVSNVLEPTFPLNQFQNLLDFSRASIGGHSFGGATTIVTLAEDKRFKLGFCLDPWMLPLREETTLFSSITQKMLFVNTEKFQTTKDLGTMQRIQSHCPHGLQITTLQGTVHLNHTDVPFICHPFISWFLGAFSRMDRFKAMDLTTRLTMVFLSKNLDLPMNENYANYIRKHQDVMTEGIPPLPEPA